MNTVLGIVAGMGVGFFLGQVWLLWKQRKGYLLPVNPYAIPVMESGEKIGTVMTPQGAKVVKRKETDGGVIDPPSNKRPEKAEEGDWR